jgi:hypothetical protein
MKKRIIKVFEAVEPQISREIYDLRRKELKRYAKRVSIKLEIKVMKVVMNNNNFEAMNKITKNKHVKL